MREFYAIQPYKVGNKHAESLAIIIPAKIVRQCNIDPSTILKIQADLKTKIITLKTICERTEETKNVMTSTGGCLAASSQ